jgi:glycolate oxidase
MNPPDFQQLRRSLKSPDSLISPPAGRDEYFHDATHFTMEPLVLLLAESVEDVITAVRFCHQQRVPVTPRGAGTGLSGGCVASRGALVLSTERLRELEILPESKSAICGPGVITKELVDAAAGLGLTYPPDPASYEESTLGGNVAEGAGGLRCKRFGVTKDYVLGLEAVLPDGSLIRTGYFNNYQGFSIGDLLIASEGTLAIVTRMALRLIDLPDRGETLLIAFDEPRKAAQTVSDITAAGIVPTVMEYLDGDAAACSNQYERTEGLDNAAAILLLETSDAAQGQTDRIRQFCEKNDCSYLRTESDPEQAEALWRIRRNLSKAVNEIGAFRISEDVAVPCSRFPLLVDFVAQMNRQSPLRINSFGHAGDGNLHVNFIAPSDSAEDLAEVDRWVAKLLKKTVEFGGTLSGEHGIGLSKKQYMDLEFDLPTLAAMRKLKAVFDPDCLFNPDKIFPIN